MTPLEHLDLYVARVDELRRTRLLRNGLASSITIRWSVVKGLRFESRDPDDDDLRSFLVAFRHFTLQREPVYLGRIYGLCHRLITSDGVRERLAKSREAWKAAMRRCGIKLVLDGQEVTPEHAADLWINGHYFHSDEDKRRHLSRLVPPASLAVKQHFLNFLVDTTQQVIYVGNAIVVARREGLLAAG